jgi:hypothetical protein
MACPEVADGGDGLRILKVIAKVLNKALEYRHRKGMFIQFWGWAGE